MPKYRIRPATPISERQVITLVRRTAEGVGRDVLRERKTPKSPIGRPVPGEFRQFELLRRRVTARLTKTAIMKALGEMHTTKKQKQLVWDAQRRFVQDTKNPNAGINFEKAVVRALGEKKTRELFHKFDQLMKVPRKTMADELMRHYN